MNKKHLLDSPSSSVAKRTRLNFDLDSTPNQSTSLNFHNSPKYKPNSLIQADSNNRLVSMIVKCMLPPSIVHNPAFVDYIKYLDPSFQMPTRRTLKKTTLSKMKIMVQNKIKSVLANIPFINTSMDAWTDAAVRPFNGFVAQGIDTEWNLHTIPIAFEYINGIYSVLVK